MKKRENIFVYMVVMALAVVLIVLSLRMHYFATKAIPLTVSSILFILTAIGLLRGILAKGESGPTAAKVENGDEEETRESWYAYSLVGAWVLGLFLAIYLLGFIIAIPLFLLSYLKMHGAKWRLAITCAAATTAIVYIVLVLALNVFLYKGLLFS